MSVCVMKFGPYPWARRRVEEILAVRVIFFLLLPIGCELIGNQLEGQKIQKSRENSERFPLLRRVLAFLVGVKQVLMEAEQCAS